MSEAPPQMNTVQLTQAKSFGENQIRTLIQNLFDALWLKDINGVLSFYGDEVVTYDLRDHFQEVPTEREDDT